MSDELTCSAWYFRAADYMAVVMMPGGLAVALVAAFNLYKSF